MFTNLPNDYSIDALYFYKIKFRFAFIQLPMTLVWRKDLRTCSEIIQTCISLDIPLDPNYGRKLVMLLLAPKQPQAITAKGRDSKKTAPSVEFKF